MIKNKFGQKLIQAIERDIGYVAIDPPMFVNDHMTNGAVRLFGSNMFGSILIPFL